MCNPFSSEWTQNFQAMELERRCLRTFLKYIAVRGLECQNLQALQMRAEAVVRRANFGLQLLNDHYGEKEATETRAFSVLVADVVDEVKQIMRLETREVHRIMSKLISPHQMSYELVVEFIESVMENLREVISFKVDLLDSLKITLEALEDKLGFLGTLLVFTGVRCSKDQKLNDLFGYADVVAHRAVHLIYACLVNEMDKDTPLDTLVSDFSDLVRKIDPVNPEARQIFIGALETSSESSPSDDLYSSEMDEITVDFVEFLQRNVEEVLSAGLAVPARDQVKILQEELGFLRSFFVNRPNLDTETQTLTHSNHICRSGSVVYALYDNEMNAETAEKLYSSLVDLLAKIKLSKEEILMMHPNPTFPEPPKTDELGFLDCFIGNLRELLDNGTESITCLNLPIGPLVEELHFLRSFLGKIDHHHLEEEKIRVLRSQIIDVAYKAEYIIDSLLVGKGYLWYHFSWLSEIRKKMKALKVEVNEIGDTEMRDSETNHDVEIFGQALSEATSPEMDEVVVGFEDEEERIREHLVRGPGKLQIVSIVGMPGLGKTHLAKKVYHNLIVKEYFDVRVWCYVSQAYNIKSLLTRILSYIVGYSRNTPSVGDDKEPSKTMPTSNLEDFSDQATSLTDYLEILIETLQDFVRTRHSMESRKTMSEMPGEEEQLAELLYKSLKGRRYLILLDDLWDVKAWNAMRRSFPDDNNGSRIMFTSRLHNLMESYTPKVHQLRPLSDGESWQLLQEKLFQGKSCPSELLEAGQQIAKNCNGLPLAVVVVAGILARIDKAQHHWRKFVNSQSAYIAGDPQKQSIQVIELSYKRLPNYLKPCFLYIGAFLKNRYIPVKKLICLWIAEGFIRKTEKEKSLENIAMDYLMDLVDRSLVTVTERKSSGDVKECRVHDLLRDFCVKKAKEEKFLQLLEEMPSFDSSTPVICEQRRVSCSQPRQFFAAKASGPCVRSLLLSSATSSDSITSHDISSVCRKFKLLRVLDLEDINLHETFPDGIDSLARLRYLAIWGNFYLIPASIVSLWNLETFIVKGSNRKVHLPETIFRMVNLRHLHVNHIVFLGRPAPSCGHVFRLDHIQTISTPLLSHGDGMLELIKGFANVKELRCIFLESWDHSKNCNQLPKLANLTQLDSLRVSYNGKVLQPYELSLPLSIKELIMSGFHLPWSQMSIIGQLPNLVVLKLLDEAFEGEEWNMGDGEFPKLKFLKLRNLNVRKWNISCEEEDDALPHLEKLVMQSCLELEEIPCYRLGGITTLNTIEVRFCHPSLRHFLRQIREEQLDMGNEQLKVVYKHATGVFVGKED